MTDVAKIAASLSECAWVRTIVDLICLTLAQVALWWLFDIKPSGEVVAIYALYRAHKAHLANTHRLAVRDLLQAEREGVNAPACFRPSAEPL